MSRSTDDSHINDACTHLVNDIAKTIMRHHDVLGYTFTEIANDAGVSKSTVRKLAHAMTPDPRVRTVGKILHALERDADVFNWTGLRVAKPMPVKKRA